MPELVLESNGRTWTLDVSRTYTLGRDPQGDVVLDDARVSWRHATISWSGRSWFIEDHGSTNGTFVQGHRIQQLEIGPGSAVHLGNATDGPRLNLSSAASGSGSASGSASAAAAAPAASPQADPRPQSPEQPYAAQGANPGWAAQPS
ncbi:FHA domain-containing protein, partial [Streptomyces sp. CRN 30]|uniref:FHA domain-containing protein n=1 Tax=Streptomyces sp. CRN 30 TaxID=3075613 RepID=UPI002A805B8F